MDTRKIKQKLLSDFRDEFSELTEKSNNFLLKRLHSKKNIVYEIKFEKKPNKFPKEAILKLYRTNFAEKEYNALKKLEKQGLTVPKVLFYKKSYIILKKINGVNLCDFINKNLGDITILNDLNAKIRNNIIFSVKKLAEWIARLHNQNVINKQDSIEIITLNKGDTRLRNFIFDISNQIIYGIDFEETYEGNYHNDLAWICCSLLDTNPGIFEMVEPTPKIELINIFLKEYYLLNDEFHFSFNYFAERLIENLNIVIKRRNLRLSKVNKKAILKNISTQL